ncbi:hypothetical protein Tco_0536873 [Tanacetum coccineum]
METGGDKVDKADAGYESGNEAAFPSAFPFSEPVSAADNNFSAEEPVSAAVELGSWLELVGGRKCQPVNASGHHPASGGVLDIESLDLILTFLFVQLTVRLKDVDVEALDASEKLIEANPEFMTTWNYSKLPFDDKLQALINEEFKIVSSGCYNLQLDEVLKLNRSK